MQQLTEIRRLPIRRRAILTGDGSYKSHRTVFCPQREESVTTNTCSHCPKLVSLRDYPLGGAVACELPTGGRKADISEVAARMAVGELTCRDFNAVMPDVEVATIESMLTGGKNACVVVVDGRGSVMGLVSKTDLVRERTDGDVSVAQEPPRELGRGFHVEMSRPTAEDVMTRGVYCLPENARLSQAIGLMAVERIEHVPIVDVAGGLVGVLHGDDVIAWLAREIGYVRAGSTP